MKRFHVHVAVKELQDSIRFYSAMFGTQPAIVKPDYAKWMLEDPRINFAISQRSASVGVNHLGFQADTEDELEGIHANLQRASEAIVAEKGVHCCYAKSDKYWVTDPQGIAWESFRSLGPIPLFGEEANAASGGCGSAQASGCCAATPHVKKAKQGCCASGT